MTDSDSGHCGGRILNCWLYFDELQGSNASDRIAIDAIKYNLVAIGEAANHISEELRRAHQEVDWPAIVGLRNLLRSQVFPSRPRTHSGHR